MTKKILIVTLLFIAGALGIGYHQALIQERNEHLIASAYYGDLQAVKEDIENGAALDFTFYFSDEEREYTNMEFNALHAAASGGNEDIINYLLEQGLDINAQTPNGWTPLFIAARDGQAETAKLLISSGADLNIQTDLGATPLFMAITQPYPTEKERTALVTYMLKRGANPNLTTQNGRSALFYAAATRRVNLVKLLLENGAEVTQTTYQEITDLFKNAPTATDKKMAALLKRAAQHKPI